LTAKERLEKRRLVEGSKKAKKDALRRSRYCFDRDRDSVIIPSWAGLDLHRRWNFTVGETKEPL
jgi:hypothetical protein